MGLIDSSIDLRQAIDRLEQGRADEAEAALAEILKAHPADGEAWYYRGRVRRAMGDSRGALFCAARATVLVPEWSLPWGLLAEMQDRLEGSEAAVDALEKASQIDPGWIDIRSHLARGYWRMGRRDDAMVVLDRILEDQPDNHKARALRGAYRFARRRLEDAHADLAPLVADEARLAEVDGSVILTAARLAKVRGDKEEAERLARWAITEARLDKPMLVKFSRVALGLGDAELAAEFGRRACKLDPGDGQANLILALSLDRLGDTEGASVHLKRACDAMPRAIEWLPVLGNLYVRLNMPLMAERMFEATLRHYPDRTAARLGLIQVLMRRGDGFGALEVAEAGLDRSPNSIELKIAVARALAELDRLDEAVEMLREACRTAPDSGEAAFALGDKLAAAERWEEAEEALIRAHELMPLDRRVQIALGTCRARMGRVGDDLELSRAFALQARNERSHGLQVALQSFALHLRTVEALCRRDIRIRFGRESLGYLWAFIEPLMFVAIFYGLFLAINRHVPAGMTTLTFLISGVVPWVMFSSTYGRVMAAVRGNQTLLFFPQVKPIDLFAARAILEYFTIMVVFVVLMAAVHVIQPMGPIGDTLKIISSLTVAWLMGVGLGMTVTSIVTVVPSYDKIMGYGMRVLFFTSGVFFLPGEMPQVIQDVLVFNPMLHVIDRMREGLFVDYRAADTSFAVAVGVAVVLLFLGLLGEALTRARPDK